VVRISDRESGLSARTIARRLSTVSGFYAYLVARGDTPVTTSPVPRGLSTRRQAGSVTSRTVPLVRVPRTLPKILSPLEVDALIGALRSWRDRAMVEAMLLGGLRRCEVLGLRLVDVLVADRRVFVADGKGGHQRFTPMANRFFTSLGHYLDGERPATDTDRVFVVLKGQRRGRPLSAAGVDEVLSGARRRARLTRGTCHELRHTCLTRLREAGMSLEAVGHAVDLSQSRLALRTRHLARVSRLCARSPSSSVDAAGAATPFRRGQLRSRGACLP
jgi:integrase/recombinase XerD